MNSIVIFLHVPKAAGTTLRVIAEKQYPLGAILPLYADDAISPRASIRRMLSAYPTLRMIRGHVAYGIHEALPEGMPYRYITLVREPVARVVSLYRYQFRSRNHPFQPEVCKMTLGEYMRSGIDANARNGMVAQLSGTCGELPQKPYEKPVRKPDNHALDVALENLRAFTLVGPCERFTSCLKQLNKHLGWHTVKYRDKNRSAGTYLPSHQDITEVAGYNQLDIQLYRDIVGGKL